MFPTFESMKKVGKIEKSKKFLLKRGYCCYSGCLHCPYKKEQNPDIPVELSVPTEEDNMEAYYLQLAEENSQED